MNRATYEKIIEKYENNECLVVCMYGGYALTFAKTINISTGNGINAASATVLVNRIIASAKRKQFTLREIVTKNTCGKYFRCTDELFEYIRKELDERGIKDKTLYIYKIDSMRNGSDHIFEK